MGTGHPFISVVWVGDENVSPWPVFAQDVNVEWLGREAVMKGSLIKDRRREVKVKG